MLVSHDERLIELVCKELLVCKDKTVGHHRRFLKLNSCIFGFQDNSIGWWTRRIQETRLQTTSNINVKRVYTCHCPIYVHFVFLYCCNQKLTISKKV